MHIWEVFLVKKFGIFWGSQDGLGIIDSYRQRTALDRLC